MASCDSCGSSILFGGKRQGDFRFCNDKCLANGQLAVAASQMPDDVVRAQVQAIHKGPCPKCQGPGPVDVRVSHTVWSALFMTSWKSTPRITCRACGVKRQALDATSSLLLGWWGVPWGIVVTPMQVLRNLAGMLNRDGAHQPSPRLVKQVRLILASERLSPPMARGRG